MAMGARTALPAAPAAELDASPEWEAALALLRPRARHPRRPRRRPCAPTAATCASSRRGRPSAGSRPGGLAYRDLRAYAAALSERRLAKATRRAASSPRCAACTPTWSPPAWRPRTRPTCCRRRSAAPRCRACSGATRSPACSTGSRRRTRSRSATGRCSSSPTRAGCAPTSSSRSTSATSTSTPRRCAPPARARRPAWSRSASRRSARCAATSSPRGTRSGASRDGGGAVRLAAAAGASRASDVRRRLDKWVREAAVAGRRLAAHAAALVRHPSARGRRRPALDPGTAGTLERVDDADLHPRRADPAAPRVRKGSPACIAARR